MLLRADHTLNLVFFANANLVWYDRLTIDEDKTMLKTLVGLGITLGIGLSFPVVASAFSVCGLQKPQATFKTTRRLITICRGEASFQMIMTYYDGTGYQIIPVQREKNLYRGTDGINNFIVNNREFIIGSDGEPPQRERVIQAK